MNAARAFAWPKALIGMGIVLVDLVVLAVATTNFRNGSFYPLDLDVYRVGAQVWMNGDDLYGVLPPTTKGLVLPFTYPPISAVLFWPATILPLTLTGVLLAVLGAVLLGLVIVACVDRSRALVAAAALPVAL